MSAPDQVNGSAQEAIRAAEPEQYQGLPSGSYTDLKLVGQLKVPPHLISTSSLITVSMNSAMPPLIICI